MIQIQKLTPDDKAVRTQITLTKNIKKEVENMAFLRGESLSEFIRKAAMLRLLLEDNKKQDLSQIAKKYIGSIDLSKNPNWSTEAKVEKWLRDIREEE